MAKKDRVRGAFMRTCAGCGGRFDKREHGFLRIANKNGETVLDENGNLGGRGAYIVCACDASDRTKATVEAFNIKTIHTDMTKQELGAALGMGNVAVVGITDAGFAAATESKQGERTYGKI